MSRLPPIIGITGKAGAGKDTLALHLVTKYNYHRRAFADPIKELLNERFGWEMSQWDDREWKERPNSIYGSRWQGSEDGKFGRAGREFFDTFSPRSWAQWLGTEVGRNTFGEDCWVDAMDRWCRANMGGEDRLVIPDVRFNNEAEWIQRMGGRIIRVSRPDTPGVAPHASEHGIDDTYVNFFLVNNTSIENMYNALECYMEGFDGT